MPYTCEPLITVCGRNGTVRRTMYDPISIARLNLCHPVLKQKVLAAMDDLAKDSIYFRVAQGLRTYAEQDSLYALGRTVLTTSDGKRQGIVTNARGGFSNHNFGYAVDCYPFLQGQKGNLNFDPASAQFQKMVDALKAQGLAWGGDWQSMKDYPHFQLSEFPVTPTSADRVALAEGGVAKVWEQYPVEA